MAEKIMSAGIKREKSWLYYLDSQLAVRRAKMVSGGKRKQPGDKPELILETGLKRDPSYLYYVDKSGDISRIVANRGSRSKASKRKQKAA